MEQLIILIVMLAVGSIFGKKKEKPEDKKTPSQQRPVHTQTTQVEREPKRTNAAPTNKPRSLKDLSRNLFEDIQKEFKDLQTEMEEPQKTQAPQTEIFYPQQSQKPQPKQRTAPQGRTERSERQPSRGRLHSEKTIVKVEETRILQEDLIPKTSKQVLQGIVYSEILGPPKAKR